MAERIPPHLKKYVVEQNYSRYTAEDQAVWRFIMRQLKDFLSLHAHECYVDGLKKTGIDVERIPEISHMNEMLSKFGWGAVPVSGFIPPAAFMEFQSLGILPIASDMRTIQHLQYTPAPDIVHEAAGHAPILVEPAFAAYLRQYAEVARRALVHQEDLDQYAAIRHLSDVKENPSSTPTEIRAAEEELAKVNAQIKSISEAGWLSRMNWWTAEYGLIGKVDKPKIFGAGLLSSVGESRHCLEKKVRKIPLSVDCIDVGYDITEPQPQLFVTPDFERLLDVLDDLADRMAFRIGGIDAIRRARAARTLTTCELDSGLQVSGIVEKFDTDDSGMRPVFLKWRGPVQLSVAGTQIPNHGKDFHAHGFSTPLGLWEKSSHPHKSSSNSDLERLGLREGARVQVKYPSGIQLTGTYVGAVRHQEKLLLLRFDQCTVRNNREILYQPEWGVFDLAVGSSVISVFGGAADRSAYGETDDFAIRRVPSRTFSVDQEQLFNFLLRVRRLREHSHAQPTIQLRTDWQNLGEEYFASFGRHWLPAVELVELTYLLELSDTSSLHARLVQHLRSMTELDAMAKECVADGLKLADIRL